MRTAPPATSTDLYQLTMAAGHWQAGRQARASYELFPRRLPKDSAYLLAGGLADVIEYLTRFHFTEAEIAYMRDIPSFSAVPINFFDDLARLRFTGDVWASSGGAELVGNVLPNGYVYRFLPSTMKDKIPEQYTQPLVMGRLGTSVFAYNSELNDTCPITNVWELTQEEWKGKFFIEDPLNDASTLSKLLTFAGHTEEMKAAYVELYGQEPVLAEDTPDAGWLWLKKFAQNDPQPKPGGDEVDEAFATPGMTESYMALTSYSNMADVVEGNLAFEPCWGIKPMLGVQSQSYLGIINQAPHPNAAKLWIAWQLSEEGRDPWAKFGTYFTDSTYEVEEGMKPLRIAGLSDQTGGPAFSTCAGLIGYALNRNVEALLPAAAAAKPGAGPFGMLRWVKEHFLT